LGRGTQAQPRVAQRIRQWKAFFSFYGNHKPFWGATERRFSKRPVHLRDILSARKDWFPNDPRMGSHPGATQPTGDPASSLKADFFQFFSGARPVNGRLRPFQRVQRPAKRAGPSRTGKNWEKLVPGAQLRLRRARQNSHSGVYGDPGGKWAGNGSGKPRGAATSKNPGAPTNVWTP